MSSKMRTVMMGIVGTAMMIASFAVASPASAVESPEVGVAAQFEIRSNMNHKCLEILGLDNSNGAHAGTWDCWNGGNQKWYWNGSEIRSGMNHKCLEILGLDNSNGAHVGMWDCWGGANQQWYWNGSELRSRMNHKCLEILGLNNSNGAHAGTWDCWNGGNQKWREA